MVPEVRVSRPDGKARPTYGVIGYRKEQLTHPPIQRGPELRRVLRNPILTLQLLQQPGPVVELCYQ
ncbi:MAG: hypothetical protein ACOC88_02685, partial [Candidatus Bipolaricaulota bacterium]